MGSVQVICNVDKYSGNFSANLLSPNVRTNHCAPLFRPSVKSSYHRSPFRLRFSPPFCSLRSALCRRRLDSASSSRERLDETRFSEGFLLLLPLATSSCEIPFFCSSYSLFLLSIVDLALYFCFGNLGF